MRVTVLGKSPSWQDVDGACSGYLVQQDDTRVLLDCGSGVFAKLRRALDYRTLDAVVLSHLHADHFLDLVPFSYALQYGPPPEGTSEPPRAVLHGPRGARETFRRVVGAWGGEDLIERSFDIREYDAGDAFEIGALRVATYRVDHFVPTCAVAFTARDGGPRFVFGADTGPTELLVDAARDAEVLMVEATLPEPDGEDGEARGHLTAAEAGEHAKRANVRRLVLTHYSDQLDEEWLREQAEQAFGGPVTAAREGDVYEIGE